MSGLIAWMTRNRVAANLLMAMLVVGGLVAATHMKQEVFPEFAAEAVTITVSYPGASPEDVEQGVLLAIEDAVSGLEGVDEVTSRAAEGSGSVTIELQDGADVAQAVDDARSAVSTISSFPDEAETPEVSELTRRRDVLTVMVSGDQDLRDLHQLALDLKEAITASPDASVVEISGAPERVLDIQVSGAALQAYDLTLDEVAAQVTAGSLQRGAGTVRTRAGDLTVRIDDRKVAEADFATIPVRTSTDGATVRLGDIATIQGGYEDSDSSAWFAGDRAVRLGVYRIGDETPSDVSAAVRSAVEEMEGRLPPSVALTVLSDSSEVLDARLTLLAENAALGLVLVLGILALFLDLRTAVWVSMGIPTSFFGAFLLLLWWGVSINMISLFAFLVVLGLVVDDAIVVGEQVFYEQEQGDDAVEAAVGGAGRMLAPVIVAMLTTVFAFTPILGIPGRFGKVFAVFPVVIIAVLIMSLVESFFILPAHLSHVSDSKVWNVTEPVRRRFATVLRRFIEGPYRAVLHYGVTHRATAYALGFAAIVLAVGLVGTGRVPVRFFPEIAGETVTATARLPSGTSDQEVTDARRALEDAAYRAADSLQVAHMVQGVESITQDGDSGSEEIITRVHLSSDDPDLRADRVAAIWSRTVPDLGPDSTLSFRATRGPDAGEAVNVSLSHTDPLVLDQAVDHMLETLRAYPTLTNVESSLSVGTEALELQLTPAGEALGLTTQGLSSQVRAAFEGAEAYKEIDGRTERTVRVRLPEAERVHTSEVGQLPVRIDTDAWAPLDTVAELVPSVAPAEIRRSDGRREVSATADLAPGVASATAIREELMAEAVPQLLAEVPGLSARMRGEAEEQEESQTAMISATLMALMAIYSLLAATFRSYSQPIVVMSVIPFAIVGAVYGHFVVGLPLSMISGFGVIALAGVVVNDSLVLMDAANELRAAGATPVEAITQAGERRFRPILLTSLTTFLGLAPMITETSIQAQFLIPMAVSLGFGILLATVVVLLLVPVIYLTLDDVVSLRWWPVAEGPLDGDALSHQP